MLNTKVDQYSIDRVYLCYQMKFVEWLLTRHDAGGVRSESPTTGMRATRHVGVS